MASVYFIQKSNKDVYKVGMTGSLVENRLKSLQTGSEEQLTLCATMICKSSRSATEIEREIHTAFAKQRLYGEWFNMTWGDVQSVLSIYAAKGHPINYPRITMPNAGRFVAGASGRVKDTESAALHRALARVAALEKANNELIENRIAWLRQEVGKEVRAEYYPEIKITEREIDLRDREIIRLQKEINRLTRPSWWQRFTQLFQQKARVR